MLLLITYRLTPQNAHQQPSVVVLCGPHVQGAQGVNCARHLATHNIQVTLFMPSFVKVLQELEDELKLYDLCDGIKTSSVKGQVVQIIIISNLFNT